MKKSVLSGFVIAVSVVIVISFFLPWAKVSVSVVGASRELTGTARTTLKDSPTARKWLDKLEKATDAVSSYGDVGVNTQVSGYDIPVLVNNKSSKVAISAAQIMFKSAENLDMKSYLVYLLPILGILCAVASVLGQKNKLYIIVMILVAGAGSLVVTGYVPSLEYDWTAAPDAGSLSVSGYAPTLSYTPGVHPSEDQI